MIPKIERLSRVYELQGFPYGLKHVAAPFWLLFLLKVDLGGQKAHPKSYLGFVALERRIGNLDTVYFGEVRPRYIVSACRIRRILVKQGLDTSYLHVGYCVFSWYLVKFRRRYAIDSYGYDVFNVRTIAFMTYSFKLQNARLLANLHQ
ncbi:hypothetical protein Tco_1515466 [Tanacetum coccineum]